MLNKIEVTEMLTPLKVKVINAFRPNLVCKLQDIVETSKLNYKQISWIVGKLEKARILKRSEWGKYTLTELGDNYLKVIDMFNLTDNSYFKYIGYVDVYSFLNGKEGAIILGGLLSDGTVSNTKIQFFTTDESLNKYVWNNLEKLFNKQVNKKYGFIDGRLQSDFLRLFTPTYRKAPFRENGKIISWTDVKIPDFIMKGTKEQKIEFLKTYFSGDGGVVIELFWNKTYKLYDLTSWVLVACKNPTLKTQLSQLLTDLGFSPNTKSDYQNILLGKNVINFKSIGFVEDCKVVQGKYWKGIEKNELLNLAIVIKQLGPDILPPYLRKDKTKDKEIRNYLLSIAKRVKEESLEVVVSELQQIRNRNTFLRKLSPNWLNTLEILENDTLSYDQIIEEMLKRNYKKSLTKEKKGVSYILSKLKKLKLINNERINCWTISKQGKKILEEYRLLVKPA